MSQSPDNMTAQPEIKSEENKKIDPSFFTKAGDLAQKFTSYEAADAVYKSVENGSEASPQEYGALLAMIKHADANKLRNVATYIKGITKNRPKEFIEPLQRRLAEKQEYQKDHSDMWDFAEKNIKSITDDETEQRNIKKAFEKKPIGEKYTLVLKDATGMINEIEKQEKLLNEELAKNPEAKKKEIIEKTLKKFKDLREAELSPFKIQKVAERYLNQEKRNEAKRFNNILASFTKTIPNQKARYDHKVNTLKKLGLYAPIEATGKTPTEEDLDAAYTAMIEVIPEPILKKFDIKKIEAPAPGKKEESAPGTPAPAKKESPAPVEETPAPVLFVEDPAEETRETPGEKPEIETPATKARLEAEEKAKREREAAEAKRLREEAEEKAQREAERLAEAERVRKAAEEATRLAEAERLRKEAEKLSPEKIKEYYTGKFIRAVAADDVLLEITDVSGPADKLVITALGEDGEPKTIPLKNIRPKEGLTGTGLVFKSLLGGADALFEIVERAERLSELKDTFVENMKEDLKGNFFKKTWLNIKKALWGQKLETGLSKETKESLGDLNDYIDRLITSAEKSWESKGYSAEQIQNLKDRYRARYMSGIQLETEFDALAKEKAENSSTILTKMYGWSKKWIAKIPPGVKIGLVAAAVAGVTFATGGLGAAAIATGTMGGGMTLSMIVSRKARALGKTAAAWGGFGVTQGIRGLSSIASGREFLLGGAAPIALGASITRLFLETIHATKGDGEKMKELRTKLEEGNAKLEWLNGMLARTDLSALDRTNYETEKKSITDALTTANELFKRDQGKYDVQVKDLQAAYNRGELTPSEYLKQMQKHKTRDEIMETLKKSMTILALGAAAYTAIDHFTHAPEDQGGSGGTDPKPEDGGDKPIPDDGGDKPIPEDDGNKVPLPEDQDKTPLPEDIKPEDINNDAIVRKGEGITHAFKRQLDHDPELTKVYETKLGMDYEANKGVFLAKLAKEFGYIDSAGNDVRVSEADVTAYQLSKDGTVSEFDYGAFKESHSFGAAFEKPVDSSHEYSWDGSKQYVGGHGAPGLQPETTPVTHDGPETTPLGGGGPETTKLGGGPETTPLTKVGNKLSPDDLLNTKPNPTVTLHNSVRGLDALDENLNPKEYTKLMETEATQILTGSSDSLSSEQIQLKSVMAGLQTQTGLAPQQYESSEQYLDRAFKALGSDVTVAKIHAEEFYVPTSPDGRAFVGETPKETYNNFLDQYFNKKDGGWRLEGAEDIKYKTDVAPLKAQDFFRSINQGTVTADTLAKQLEISSVSAAKLFDFFKATKSISEITLEPGFYDSKTTVDDIVQKMTTKVTELSAAGTAK